MGKQNCTGTAEGQAIKILQGVPGKKEAQGGIGVEVHNAVDARPGRNGKQQQAEKSSIVFPSKD